MHIYIYIYVNARVCIHIYILPLRVNPTTHTHTPTYSSPTITTTTPTRTPTHVTAQLAGFEFSHYRTIRFYSVSQIATTASATPSLAADAGPLSLGEATCRLSLGSVNL